jgi:hypothetical protein
VAKKKRPKLRPKRDFKKLRNKLLSAIFNASRGNLVGYRTARIEKVHYDRRAGIVDLITVRIYNGEGPAKYAGFNGKRVRLERREFASDSVCCGVVYRGKLVPVDEFVGKYCPEES